MFLEFGNVAQRDAFIERAKREEPQAASHIWVSQVQPNVVTVTGVTPHEARRLSEVAGDAAQVYGDVQFETFEPR